MSEVALLQETVATPETVTLADCSPAQQVEQRYVTAVNVLVAEALEHDNLPILADVLAWNLGRVIVAYGTPAVAGDILRRLGGYVCDIAERQRAQAEAELARKEGQKTH
jgi:hypothetical protein